MPAISSNLLTRATISPEHQANYDVVVVGAGVAGLAFTLRLPAGLRVALLTKGALGESNTRYAQGGLAAAVGYDDSPSLHEQDTLAAGAGLCDPVAVHELVAGAPAAVDWLLDLGAQFDRADQDGTGDLLLGREAAHSRRRVLHAGGDATGAEIERALVSGVRSHPNVDIFEHAFAGDLTTAAGRCTGLIAELAPDASWTWLIAPTVVLANGGAGRLWATTSNPAGATADGIAMALRAGAAIADLEFTQFHPTVLALPDDVPFLISEAVRGEGAYLRDAVGHRFMVDEHPLAELAPRDVVARAIQRRLATTAGSVFLDLRHLDAAMMRARFPTIARELAARGLNLTADLIPVAPAAHYFMGGIAAATSGQTSLPGLLALGETACTGVHGANRLASNSLLEGLVFGLNAADGLGRGQTTEDRGQTIEDRGQDNHCRGARPCALPAATATEINRLRTELQAAMSRDAAVVRDADGLRRAGAAVAAIAAHLVAAPPSNRHTAEVRNMTLVASAIATAAYGREESRGSHFRADYPALNPALDGRHQVFGGDAGWRFIGLAEALKGAALPAR